MFLASSNLFINYQFKRRKLEMKKLLVLALVIAAMLIITVPVFGNGVIHRVSVGTADACAGLGFPVGCDANFSLQAILFSNGNVKGQYSDQFTAGNGFHAVIDCLVIDGNQAWVSGVITSGSFEGVDLTGLPVATTVFDNGTSAHDVPDQISFSWVGDPTSCTEMAEYPLFDALQGQVVVVE
jgi:hypothetical protein